MGDVINNHTAIFEPGEEIEEIEDFVLVVEGFADY
jgi:hypothetical protein